MDIQGTVALVTGACSGLGAATARRLASAGAHVVGVDLDLPPDDVQRAEKTGAIQFEQADVTQPEDIMRAIERGRGHGPLRIVVNCAGIGTPGRTIGRNGPLDLDQFRRILEVNLLGTFNVVRLAAAEMLRDDPAGEERGVIVNTSSVAAFDGQIGQAAYSASKGGVVGMTLPLARDLAEHSIRVMTIAPGMFSTPILEVLPDAARASLSAQVPHPSRLGDPREFAELVAHIVENPMLNGETIRLDGALRMSPR